MMAWAILTLALTCAMLSSDDGRDHFDREVGRCNGDPMIPAFGLLGVSALVTAPVALAWWAVKAFVLAVLR